jgi:hypothetical protein
MIEAKLTPAQLRRIEKAIEKLSDAKTVDQLVVKASRIAANSVLIGPAKALTPKRSGRLRRSCKVRTLKKRSGSVGVSVGYSDKEFTGDAFYGGFIEYGWKAGKKGTGIAGQFNLKKVADQNGEAATALALKLINQNLTALIGK